MRDATGREIRKERGREVNISQDILPFEINIFY